MFVDKGLLAIGLENDRACAVSGCGGSNEFARGLLPSKLCGLGEASLGEATCTGGVPCFCNLFGFGEGGGGMAVFEFEIWEGAAGGARVGGSCAAAVLSAGIGFRSTCWWSLRSLASVVKIAGRY